ncbi:major facilitator superfamily MFS_1 [Caldithrix abyssi DSM 13497]|uniref:Fucose permease n=1 Tax=Caldithrix abyssi DSM 13497 TaxID=880073 RepID=H1XTR9_CALAY|nr:sugar MFS transporter [Caldithrix abyssi]APF18706.1 Fucose permease [Caldithrix abyssi DSM 13497]EHO42686.1 major facilitator superfamily MFS_1 [Caldithrix abyssi DSM 13497]
MKRNYFIVLLIFLVFFVISFLTNILGPLIPDIINSFHLSLTMAGFLPFAFFIAYGVMSIPAGMLVELYGEKPVMVGAFLLAFVAALLFALIPVYSMAIFSLFFIGVGMALLQVAINPLLRVAGGEEHFAFNSVLAQLVFGSASFLSPYLYSYLVRNLQDDALHTSWHLKILGRLTPPELPWVSLYWVFALVALIMVLVLYAARLPRVELKEDEKAGAWQTHKTLFKNKTVILFFLGIFAYVGTEQGVANWISKFLQTYHGFNPQTVGAHTVSLFWGLLTAGCVLGLLLLKLFDSRHILIAFTGAAMIALTFALFGPASVALFAFPAVGFFASVMWSIIFSLALNSLEKHHGSFSGILCTGIIGGAIVPLIIGWLGDHFGLRTGMLFLYLTLGYIFSIGFWANPLITNKTIGKKSEPQMVG